MKNDESKSYNHIFIPVQREPKKRAFFSREEKQSAEGLFVVSPCASLSDHGAKPKAKGPAPSTNPAAKATSANAKTSAEKKTEDKRITGDNYIKRYQQKKAQDLNAMQAKANEEAGAKALQTAKDAEQRGRAQQIRNALYAWKSKAGTGEYDDSVIQTMVTQLERDYYAIDWQYRPE